MLHVTLRTAVQYDARQQGCTLDPKPLRMQPVQGSSKVGLFLDASQLRHPMVKHALQL